MNKFLKDLFTENLSSKIVALFISLILWITILGRRDFVQAKDVDVELMTSGEYQILEQDVEKVRVRASGSRAALKKFIENHSSQALLIDISNLKEGKFEIQVPSTKIETPLGVKILSIKPSLLHATVIKKEKIDGQEVSK